MRRLSRGKGPCRIAGSAEQLSLVVVTTGEVRRAWPFAPAPAGNHSLPALGVRAADFLFANRTVCYVHHNMSRSGIVCAHADDFSRRTLLPTPALFPDVASE